MSVQTFETELAGTPLKIKTGQLALQATASCEVSYGETVVLATAVMSKQPRDGIDYFPLMVEYEERLYAAGKIKGSRWIKREGRPSDEAVLTARLVDRAIRPLFPEELKNEVQVILTVLSYDEENDPDIASLIAASAVLSMSSIPWKGPIGGVRIGQVEGEWVVNPTVEAKTKSNMNLIVAGGIDKVTMIEADANEVLEKEVYDAIEFSQKHIKKIIKFIEEVVAKAGDQKVAPEIKEAAEEETEDGEKKASIKEVEELTKNWVEENVSKKLFAKSLGTKSSRKGVVYELADELALYLEEQGVGKDRRAKAANMYMKLVEGVVTDAILKDSKRVDGRKLTEIRPLSSEIALLPRTHGSGLFNRGETQVLSVVTLGAPSDEQMLEGIDESGTKRFMHHYNFPGFCVGEVKPMRTPGRREIGHGALAERALQPMIPLKDEFPYTIRVVSEVLGSNGSSSMGSTCGSTLALMDAGVPIKKPVAGIAMGMASDNKGNYKILTDLQDLEDGHGGMDFKVAGTVDGITVIQMDTKTDGLSMQICKETLEQAKTARLEILKNMAKAIAVPRPELSQYAPRIISFSIDPEKIRDVIGPGGKIINEIINKTGVDIDIEQDGMVMITAVSEEGGKKAAEWIKNIVRVVEVGEVFEGKITRIMDFGAFAEVLPNQEGLIHISELAQRHVTTVTDVVNVGDKVPVKVIKIDDLGRINLSMKALQPQSDKRPDDSRPSGSEQRDKKPFKPGFGKGPRKPKH
ncbi:polyribonucleotide nucleotidyltransferase [Patescibacteria group bacterium]|nr:polyribonucleotide nucleotidyltransferase [Patescibacteria group bacterium]